MKYRSRERIAFWVDQVIIFLVTVASIRFASRYGFSEAVKLARYEELRKARNQVRAVEHELALNERALQRGLARWNGTDFDRLHLNRRAFDRMSEGDELHLLDPDTTTALTELYGESVVEAMKEHKDRSPQGIAFVTQKLYLLLDQFEDARVLIEKDIRKIEDEMKTYGLADVSATLAPVSDPEESNSDRLSALGLPPSPGWGKGSEEYKGRAYGLGDKMHLINPAYPRGPTLIEWKAPDAVKKPVRLWVYGYRRCPFPDGLSESRHADRIRAIHSGTAQDPVFVLNIPITGRSGQIVDPNQPVAWRWLLVAVEDEGGDRCPVREPVSVAVGGGEPMFERKPTDKALVLPKGYMR